MFEIITVLNVYLAADRDNERKVLDHDAVVFLRQWVAEAILPTQAFADLSPYSLSWSGPTLRWPQTNIRCITEEKATLTPDEVAKFRVTSLSGILLLAHLQKIKPPSKKEHVVTFLTCLASFTDLNDPWTCSEARDHAYFLLEDYAASNNLSTAIAGLLEERIKPLFAKTRSPAITQQGRKAVDPLPSPATAHSDLDGKAKPWKYRDAYGVTVFQWVLKHLDVRKIANLLLNPYCG